MLHHAGWARSADPRRAVRPQRRGAAVQERRALCYVHLSETQQTDKTVVSNAQRQQAGERQDKLLFAKRVNARWSKRLRKTGFGKRRKGAFRNG